MFKARDALWDIEREMFGTLGCSDGMYEYPSHIWTVAERGFPPPKGGMNGRQHHDAADAFGRQRFDARRS